LQSKPRKGFFEYTHPERIINIDETFLTLDEATQPGWAGRPVGVFYDPTGARTGRAENKASITCTGLFGSTATGVALPPHFQVKSTGKDESKRISKSIAATVPSRFRWINGSWSEPTFGCNEKGGMDAEEFRKNVKSVRYLYPDCSDTEGKRICIKCNMGPGRKDPALLAWCIQQGVVIYPSIPKTTHVTQEMDQAYGGFKTDYRKSLQELVAQKMSLWTRTSTMKSFSGQVKLSASHFGKIIFGTHADNNEQLELPNLWSKHFGEQNLLEMWAKVWVVPLTRPCLSH
jgi:hypothetical protein